MSGSDLTPDALKQQHVSAIAKSDTFRPQGVSEADARAYLDTDEGALYWYRLAEADPSATSSTIDDRALEQLTSGRELPRMETLNTHEPLVKIVPADTSPSAYSPFWTKETELDAAVKAGKNLSDHFGLPIVSEAPHYDVYRITPKVPTQVFVNTVAPTSELGGLITKAGGAEQSLVPNRRLFNDPVYVRSVDNTLNLAAEAERGGLSPNLVRSASALGLAATAIDAIQTDGHVSDLLRQGNRTGATSTIEHFGARNLGAWGGATLGAEVFGTAGAETGPADLLIGGAGAVVGAVAGDKLADAWDDHKIYNQTDPQGTTWHLDPQQPQQGWTRIVQTDQLDTDATRFSEGVPVYRTRTETAPPTVAERLTFQANNTAVELALAHTGTPRDPYTQPAAPKDAPSRLDAPWTHDTRTNQWSRTVTDQVMEHGLKSTHAEVAGPQRAMELDAAARQTIHDNLASSPRGIAEHYQAAYARNDWAKYGPMPESVASALKTPGNTLQASDGHTYHRDAKGQWTTPGLLYGTNRAEGHVQVELDATHAAERQAAPAQAGQASAPLHPPTRAITPAEPDYARDDPRHAANPDHALYQELHERIPGASEKRLLQFTAACHAGGINHANIGSIAYDENRGVMHFMSASESRPPVSVDVKTPSPEPGQSIQQIQQIQHSDQARAQIQATVQAQHAQAQQQQGLQGFAPGR